MINCKGRLMNTDDNNMNLIELLVNSNTNQENHIDFIDLKTNRD